MKHLYLLIIILFLFVFYSCGSEEEGKIDIDDTAPAKVTEVTAAPGRGEVYLSWKNPDNASFMYTKIEYVGSKGEKKYSLISKERIGADKIARDTISGFGNTDEVTFSLYACTLRGTNQGAVEIKQAPDTPTFDDVIKTIDLESDFGGIIVKWENEYPSTVFIVLNYYPEADPAKKAMTKITATGNSTGNLYTQLTYDTSVFSGEPCVIEVTVEDVEENSSEVRQFTLTPIEAARFAKANWSFPGYMDDSNEATISYSSQEAGGEGASPKGRVIAMIDGDLSTFWHAAWKTTSNYPHWFILDMGEDKLVASVALTKRQDDAKGQIGHQIFTCSDADAVNKSNPDSWQWKDHGSFAFSQSELSAQTYRLTSNPVARYIKVYFGEEHRGEGNYAMVSQIDVYGEE